MSEIILHGEENQEEEILQDQETRQAVCHVNARTRPLFKEMLNKIGAPIKLGSNNLKYGDAIYKMDEDQFESMFNVWVSKCVEKNIMTKSFSNNSDRYLKWSEALSDVERAFQSMQVLKEML